MKVIVLGAHQVESAITRCTSLLIDGVLALDAGGLSSTLSLSQQERVGAILLTHYHYDHTKDIATLGFNTAGEYTTLVACTPLVGAMVQSHFLDGRVWPRLAEYPSPEHPTIRFLMVEPGHWLDLGDYRVLGVPVRHAVPTIGYQVVGLGGQSLFYTSDTGPGWVSTALPYLLPDLQLIVTEVTFADELADVATRVGHMTPRLLREELLLYRQSRGRIPRVLVIHMNPRFEEAIRAELARVASELEADIVVGSEGMEISLPV